MVRDKDAIVRQAGTVSAKDGKIQLDLPENYKGILSSFKFKGETYTPEHPGYMEVLPLAFRGDRLWATIESGNEKEL